jgi:predicted aldo/keto reductase-like oxidoreductase
MNQPISVAVPGATTVAEMEQNAMHGALDDHTLTTAEEAEVAKWALDLATDRCRICMECLPCPSNIEIPGTLGTDVMYNHYRTIGPAKFAEFPWEKSRVDDEWKDRRSRSL